MVKRLLIPRQLKVVRGELYAKENIPAGTQFLPWDGILTTVADLPAEPVLQGDPRLYSGLVDNADLCNWVLFLPHTPPSLMTSPPALLTGAGSPLQMTTNFVVSTGPTGEPIFTAIKPIINGERILAAYQELHQALMFPALLILRCALFNKYVEKAVEDMPVDLSGADETDEQMAAVSAAVAAAAGGKIGRLGLGTHTIGSESPRSDGFDKVSEDDRSSSPDCFRLALSIFF